MEAGSARAKVQESSGMGLEKGRPEEKLKNTLNAKEGGEGKRRGASHQGGESEMQGGNEREVGGCPLRWIQV